MADTTSAVTTPEPEAPFKLEGEATPTAPTNPANDDALAEKIDSPAPELSDVPATPSKNTTKAKKTATPKTPKPKATPAKRAADGEATPKSAKKSKGTPANDRKGIPQSVEEMTAEDKMLMKFKEEGKPWSVINAEWEKLTGVKPGGSTLPNRFNRIKAAISCVAEADIEQMKASVNAVDAIIEAEHKDALSKKWTRIAKHMKDNGVEAEYQAATIEKHFKKLQAAAVAANLAKESGIESSEEVNGGKVKEEVASEETPDI